MYSIADSLLLQHLGKAWGLLKLQCMMCKQIMGKKLS